jgi:hypothetical protein
MRIAVPLVVLLLGIPQHVAAAPSVFMEFLNSDFTFGLGNASQDGWDLSWFAVDGFDNSSWDVWNTGYQARSGPLDHQTLDVDANGVVVARTYHYTGGSFEIFFALEHNGVFRSGSFVAPITGLTVWAEESDEGSADASYTFGPGLFDQSIARTLGISRRTTGGSAFSDLALTDSGNRSGVAVSQAAPSREAWDGVNDIQLDVPEPSTLILWGAGAGALWLRRRARR